MATTGLVCSICSATEDVKIIRKCPICFKLVCEECAYKFAGRPFCSKGCADYFFFGSSDEEDN